MEDRFGLNFLPLLKGLSIFEKIDAFYIISWLTFLSGRKYLIINYSWKHFRRLIYGNNEIKVEIHSIFKLLFLEVLNPFYVFQIFSVTLWLSDEYVYFATAIIIMSVFGIASTIIQTRQVSGRRISKNRTPLIPLLPIPESKETQNHGPIFRHCGCHSKWRIFGIHSNWAFGTRGSHCHPSARMHNALRRCPPRWLLHRQWEHAYW